MERDKDVLVAYKNQIFAMWKIYQFQLSETSHIGFQFIKFSLESLFLFLFLVFY